MSLAEFRSRYTDADGKRHERYWDVTMSPCREENEVRGILSFGQEVSAQVHLERTRAVLAAIVQSSNDAILGADTNGVVAHWNPAAERLLGYQAHEVIGRPVLIFIPPDRQDDRTYMEQALRGESPPTFET